MFRSTTTIEETILKREFNKWGIFELYKNFQIIIRTSENKSISVSQVEKTENKKKSKDVKYELENTVRSSLIRDRINKVHICSNREQKDLAIRLQPIYSGICIGEIRNKKFMLNLNFAEIIANQNSKLNYPYVILEEKGAKLVLYGRDIMGKSIISHNKEIKENQLLLILDKDKEVIGIGRSRYDNNLITQIDKITIDNIQDIGTYYLKSENNHEI